MGREYCAECGELLVPTLQPVAHWNFNEGRRTWGICCKGSQSVRVVVADRWPADPETVKRLEREAIAKCLEGKARSLTDIYIADALRKAAADIRAGKHVEP